jgi:hypothetical protein
MGGAALGRAGDRRSIRSGPTSAEPPAVLGERTADGRPVRIRVVPHPPDADRVASVAVHRPRITADLVADSHPLPWPRTCS